MFSHCNSYHSKEEFTQGSKIIGQILVANTVMTLRASPCIYVSSYVINCGLQQLWHFHSIKSSRLWHIRHQYVYVFSDILKSSQGDFILHQRRLST